MDGGVISGMVLMERFFSSIATVAESSEVFRHTTGLDSSWFILRIHLVYGQHSI